MLTAMAAVLVMLRYLALQVKMKLQIQLEGHLSATYLNINPCEKSSEVCDTSTEFFRFWSCPIVLT